LLRLITSHLRISILLRFWIRLMIYNGKHNLFCESAIQIQVHKNVPIHQLYASGPILYLLLFAKHVLIILFFKWKDQTVVYWTSLRVINKLPSLIFTQPVWKVYTVITARKPVIVTMTTLCHVTLSSERATVPKDGAELDVKKTWMSAKLPRARITRNVSLLKDHSTANVT
jgi:hypothetical protein